MKRLLLFGNNSEKSALMNILHKMGCVEISLAKKLDKTSYVLDENKINEYTRKLTQLEFAFDFLAEASKVVSSNAKARNYEYKPVKTAGLLIPKKSLTFDEFARSQEVEGEVFEIIDKFEKYSQQIIDLKSENTKYLSIANQLTPYRAVKAKLSSFKSTKHVAIIMGSINTGKLPLVSKLEEKGAYVEVFQDDRFVNIAVLYLKEQDQEILDILNEMDFANCSLAFDDFANTAGGTLSIDWESAEASLGYTLHDGLKSFYSRVLCSQQQNIEGRYFLEESQFAPPPNAEYSTSGSSFICWILRPIISRICGARPKIQLAACRFNDDVENVGAFGDIAFV